MHRWHSSGEKTRTQPMNLSTNWYQFVVESWYHFWSVDIASSPPACSLQRRHGSFIMCVNSEYIDCVCNAF